MDITLLLDFLGWEERNGAYLLKGKKWPDDWTGFGPYTHDDVELFDPTMDLNAMYVIETAILKKGLWGQYSSVLITQHKDLIHLSAGQRYDAFLTLFTN